MPGYPARLTLDEPPRPPRWLPLVAWLLALPHLVLLGALAGAIVWSDTGEDAAVSISFVTALALIVGGALLFTGRYPRGLFDLLVGVGRWSLRVTSYLLLLTPYPPFRLDQGGAEPGDDPPPLPARASAPATSAAGSVAALIAGVLMLIPATGLIVGGGAVLALDGARDSSGWVTSSAVSVHSSTAAVTAEDITLSPGDPVTRGFAGIGEIRISATGDGGAPLFVGVARQSDVDAWLAGAAHDELTGISSGAARYRYTDGERRAVAAPGAQTFWLAAGSGTVIWQATAGDFAVVLADPDGSTGVVADVRAAARLPGLAGPGAGLLTTGILSGLVAVLLVVIGGVGLGRRHGGAPPPPPPVGTPPKPEPVPAVT